MSTRVTISSAGLLQSSKSWRSLSGKALSAHFSLIGLKNCALIQLFGSFNIAEIRFFCEKNFTHALIANMDMPTIWKPFCKLSATSSLTRWRISRLAWQHFRPFPLESTTFIGRPLLEKPKTSRLYISGCSTRSALLLLETVVRGVPRTTLQIRPGW